MGFMGISLKINIFLRFKSNKNIVYFLSVLEIFFLVCWEWGLPVKTDSFGAYKADARSQPMYQ